MIWLEKPACVSTDELLRLGQYSLGRPTTILVNYIRRYVSVYRKLKDVFDQKLLGPPVCLQIIYSRGLLNNGAHLIDQAFFLAGDPQRFRLLDVSTPFDSSNPWFSMMLDQFVPVSVIGCPLPYHCIDLVLVCEEGRASIVHGGMTALWESKTEHELFPGFYRLKQESTRFLEPSGLNGAMAAALDDLIDAHRRKRRPISDLATAAGSQAVIEEALCKAGACQ
jgi:predicted dehydrogenase